MVIYRHFNTIINLLRPKYLLLKPLFYEETKIFRKLWANFPGILSLGLKFSLDQNFCAVKISVTAPIYGGSPLIKFSHSSWEIDTYIVTSSVRKPWPHSRCLQR